MEFLVLSPQVGRFGVFLSENDLRQGGSRATNLGIDIFVLSIRIMVSGLTAVGCLVPGQRQLESRLRIGQSAL
jgi:hypothetical protein